MDLGIRAGESDEKLKRDVCEVADGGAEGCGEDAGGGVYGTTNTGAELRVDEALLISLLCDDWESVFAKREGMIFGSPLGGGLGATLCVVKACVYSLPTDAACLSPPFPSEFDQR